MQKFLKVCERAARAGGEVLLDWQHRFKAKKKGPKDVVTEADLQSQKVIRTILLQAFPDHFFLGEESDLPASKADATGGIALPRNAYRWVVDPLDGTANYVHHLPSYAVSIGLEHKGRAIVGVVYDPLADECFSAAKGAGAFLNGKPIRPSRCRRLHDALVAVSFSHNVPRGSCEVPAFIEVLHAAAAIRRLGSAALSLAYVACGRLDGYYGYGLKAWDLAGGAIILREAGGVLTALDGSAFDLYRPEFASSATRSLQRELLQAVAAST